MTQEISDARDNIGKYFIKYTPVRCNNHSHDGLSDSRRVNIDPYDEIFYIRLTVYLMCLDNVVPYGKKIITFDHPYDCSSDPNLLDLSENEHQSLGGINYLNKHEVIKFFEDMNHPLTANLKHRLKDVSDTTKNDNHLSMRFVCLPVSINCIEVGEWLGVLDPEKDRTGNICSNFAKVVEVERKGNHTILAYTVRRNGEWDKDYQVIDSNDKTTQSDGYFRVVCGVTYIDESQPQSGLTFEEDAKAHRRLRKIK